MIFGIIVLEQVEAVIKSVLTTYHDHISSWGLCIILLTFTVRLVILPLTIKQFRSMAAMQTIQPKVKQLQNKYKGKTDRDSKQEMQKELMGLYKEHGVNPFASCLPLVAQLPVFIGLYQVLRNQIEPTPVKSFLGIEDIFQKLSTIGGFTEYFIIALYVGTMLGSTLLFSFVTDRQQKYMDEELAHLAVDAAWQSLNLRASVRRGPRGGRVEIHFTTPAELGRIVDQLRAERVSWAD